MKAKFELEMQLQKAAENMRKARIVGEQIRLASEPEPQNTGSNGTPAAPGKDSSFAQVKR